jgi:hypothetical protein
MKLIEELRGTWFWSCYSSTCLKELKVTRLGPEYKAECYIVWTALSVVSFIEVKLSHFLTLGL